MAKSVQYSIELLDSPGNVARLKTIRDKALGLGDDFKRLGEGFGNSIEAGVARAEAAFARLNEASKKGAYHEIGMGPRVGESSRFDMQPTRSQPQQLGPRSSRSIDRVGDEPQRKTKATADVPDYSTQLDSIKELGEELDRVGESSKRAKKGVDSVGTSGSGLNDVVGTFDDFETRLAQIDKEAEKAGKTFDRSGKQIRTSMSEGVEGVSRFVQGLSLLGLRNSETAAQLLDGILVVKGIGDTVVGATKIYSQFSDMIEATRRRQDAGNRSTELAAERQQLASAAVEKLSRSLREEAAVAGKLDDVHDKQARALRNLASELDHAAASARGLDHAQDELGSNGSPEIGQTGGRGRRGRPARGRGRGGRGAAVAGIVGAIGSQFVGNAIGGLGLGDAATGAASLGADAGIDALVSRAGSLGGRALAIGGAGVGSSALGGAAATVGAIAAPVAAAAAALGSLALVGKELHEIYTGQANKVGSVTDTIASWEVGLVSSVGELTGAFDLVGNAATKRAQAELDAAKRLNDMNDQIRSVKMDAGYDMRQKLGGNEAIVGELNTKAATAGMPTGPAKEFAELSARAAASFQDQSRAAGELSRQLKIARGDTIGTADDIAKANGRAEEQSSRIIQLGREQISLVEQEARMRTAGVETYIQKLGEGKRTAEDTIKTLRDGLTSGAERFAQMSDDEQQTAIVAARKAQFDPKSLSDEERSSLRSIGTQDATRAARSADLYEAQSKGFDKFFGQSERQQINYAQQQAQQFDVKIQDATQFKVEIQGREQQIVQALSGQVRSVVDASNQRIVAQTQKMVADSEARIKASFQTTNTVKRN